MPKVKEETGNVYGRLTVIDSAGSNNCGQAIWNCLCECGNDAIVVGGRLRRGVTKSCGCLSAELSSKRNSTHRLTKTRAHATWGSMLSRCTNYKNPRYKDYGARGIKVCKEWRNFEAFYADMGDAPEGMSLDRRDNDGNYEPGNCRWATNHQQIQNSRLAKLNPVAVRVIRYMHEFNGVSSRRLANAYGVHVGSITNAITGRTWANI